VLEVSMHSQGACIEGSKGAVRYWASLVKDDSGPADVEGLGHMRKRSMSDSVPV